jgi:drug/metabolite transporter (DMT)-like permease
MTLVWGVNFIVVKAALAVFHPLVFNAVRFALATAAMVAVALASGVRRPGPRDLRALAGLGIVGNTVYQLAYIEGLFRTRAGNAALIMAAIPILVGVLSHVLGHERLSWRDVAGLVLSTAGIACIVVGSGTAVALGASLEGDLLVLGATVCWAGYTVGMKPMVDRLGPTTATAWTMGLGAVPLMLIALPGLGAQPWDRVTPAAWAAVAYSGLGALVLAFLIWYRGVHRLGATRTALYSNLTPVVAVLVAWALLREVPTLWQVAGAAGIFGGIAVVRA